MPPWLCFWGNLSFLEPPHAELHNAKSSNSFSGAVCFSYPQRCFLLAPSSHKMNGTSSPSARAGLFSCLTCVAGLGIAARLAGFPSGWACSLCQAGQPEPQERPLRSASLKQGFTSQPEHHHRAQRAAEPKAPTASGQKPGSPICLFSLQSWQAGSV